MWKMESVAVLVADEAFEIFWDEVWWCDRCQKIEKKMAIVNGIEFWKIEKCGWKISEQKFEMRKNGW